MSDDPLSALLSLVDARPVCAGGFSGGGRWAIAFPQPSKIKFFVIARGECWLAVEGLEAPFRLQAGDVFLLTAQKPFVVASDLSLAPQDAHVFFGNGTPSVVDIGGGDELLFLGGHVDLNSENGGFLIDTLPPAIHLDANCAESGKLHWLIIQLMVEHGGVGPGASFARSRIVQLVFLQILRRYYLLAEGLPPGWLRAACDPRLSPALRLLHGDPARDWRLEELARAAAMSRTAFALYFKAIAGMPPLAYLGRWRMHLARRKLKESRIPIATLARSLGYSSETAFSTAFKRETGCAPSHYRTASLPRAIQ